MMIENKKKYTLILENILNNAEGLKKTSVILLKSELGKNNQKQYQAIHAQYFFYICLEEIGKFFMVLQNYPNDLVSLNKLYKKDKNQKHNEKIEILINFIKSFIKLNGGKKQLPSSQDFVKLLRNFKEPNLYTDYENNVLSTPISNKGKGVLENYSQFVSSCFELAHKELVSFKK